MRLADGSPVRTTQDWLRRKEEIRTLIMEVFTGTFPRDVPAIVSAETLREHRKQDGSRGRQVRLTFGTPHRVSFDLWVWLPPGAGPFPLLLTPPCTHDVTFDKLTTEPDERRVGWAELALARGYMVCLYPGADRSWSETAYAGYDRVAAAFQREYPDATWADIPAKAWVAGRTLDHLLDPVHGYPVAKGQVCIIGWSRHGKQALIAAAFDERITSVVSRSSSTPVPVPYRFAGRQTRMESPADTPDGWFLPSLKAYYGREHEMPMDGHGFLALIAPRRCLIHEAHNDGCGSTFALERAYLEGREVYEFLGHPENLRLQYRTGQHGPITDVHRRLNIDWFDLSFGRGGAKQGDFPEELIHRFDWKAWRSGLTPAELDWPEADDHGARILWALGQAPERIAWDGRHSFISAAESEMMGHDRWRPEDTERIPVSFGENVRGNLYHNPSIHEPVPAIVWLHPWSYHTGHAEGFGVEDYSSYRTGARGTTCYHWLARQGFAVLAFDQCGFGLRLLEGCAFPREYPRWSRLGRMVHDARSAVDFLVEGRGQSASPMPPIDTRRVYLLGYSMGGMVGLYASALDGRVAGVASFCGFTPLRKDTDRKSTGGIRRLWEWHALQPLLGLFDAREQEIPYDFDDVLRLIAPRPCLIVAPRRDRDADCGEVIRCVEAAREAWGKEGRADDLSLLCPDDINRFQSEQQDT